MSDILYEAAKEYEHLLTKEYDLVLGRKGKEYHICLKFLPESFYHLVGLQHLTDIRFPTTNKERIYTRIKEKSITEELIKKSVFYEAYRIEERIQYLKYLESMLDSSKVMFAINLKEYIKYTRIKADYLCEYDMDEMQCLYLFMVKEKQAKDAKQYKPCSFFKKGDKDYRRGTANTTILLNTKKENWMMVALFLENYIEIQDILKNHTILQKYNF